MEGFTCEAGHPASGFMSSDDQHGDNDAYEQDEDGADDCIVTSQHGETLRTEMNQNDPGVDLFRPRQRGS